MSPLVLAVLLLQPATQKPAVAVPPGDSGMVVVDGGARPDLVPEWSVWGYVFRILTGGPRQLPGSVAELTSPAERAFVLREADAVRKADAACEARLARAMTRLGQDSAAMVDDRLHEINVACRWDTLHARDTVLSGLNPAAAAALRAFAESTKTGTSISVPRKKLPRFLEPE